jgi:hypothetical protein
MIKAQPLVLNPPKGSTEAPVQPEGIVTEITYPVLLNPNGQTLLLRLLETLPPPPPKQP